MQLKLLLHMQLQLRQPPNDAIKVQLQLQLSAASEQATA
jgi:hypothetical protein